MKNNEEGTRNEKKKHRMEKKKRNERWTSLTTEVGWKYNDHYGSHQDDDWP